MIVSPFRSLLILHSGSSASSSCSRNRRRSSTDGSYSEWLDFFRSRENSASNRLTNKWGGRRVSILLFSFSSSASDRRDSASERIIVFPGLWINSRGKCARNKPHLACLLLRFCPLRKYQRLSWSVYTVTGCLAPSR